MVRLPRQHAFHGTSLSLARALQRDVPDQTRAKGVTYFRSGAVVSVAGYDDKVIAVVQGTRDYHVEITREMEGFIGSCDVPSFRIAFTSANTSGLPFSLRTAADSCRRWIHNRGSSLLTFRPSAMTSQPATARHLQRASPSGILGTHSGRCCPTARRDGCHAAGRAVCEHAAALRAR